MKFFEVNFAKAMWRFYTLMLVVIAGVLLKLPWLVLLALPIFLITLLGIKFETAETVRGIKVINKKKRVRRPKNIPQFQ